MRAEADIARVLHHVREQLPEQGVVHGVDLLVVAPHGERLVGVAFHVAVEHVLELAERQVGHVLEARHQALGVVLPGDGKGALGDVLGEVADALEITGDLQHGHDVAQVGRHRLPLGDERDGRFLQLALERVDGPIARNRGFGELWVAAGEGVEALRQQALGEAAHLRHLLVEQLKFAVESLDGMFLHWCPVSVHPKRPVM